MILPFKVDIARLSRDVDNNSKEVYVTIKNGIPMDIQPASAELTVLADGKLGQVFKAFTPVSGMALGDRVTMSGTGDQYYIRGLDNWNYGPLPHIELILIKGDL